MGLHGFTESGTSDRICFAVCFAVCFAYMTRSTTESDMKPV